MRPWIGSRGNGSIAPPSISIPMQLVWQYGLRIVLDHSGLKTVHAAGRTDLRTQPKAPTS